MRYTPYQLVYGLHLLMPIKYIVRITGGNERDNILAKVLTSKITKLQKLQEARMQVVETMGFWQLNRTLWIQQKNPKKQFSLGDYVL